MDGKAGLAHRATVSLGPGACAQEADSRPPHRAASLRSGCNSEGAHAAPLATEGHINSLALEETGDK